MIAKTFEEVGKKPLDFQSLNHIIFGFVSYLVIFLITTIFDLEIEQTWGLICFISLFVGVMWEVIENIGVPDAFFRIWGADSLENSLMDIVFNTVGIIIACVLSFLDWEIMLISGFIVMIVLVFLMYIFMKLTQPYTENGK